MDSPALTLTRTLEGWLPCTPTPFLPYSRPLSQHPAFSLKGLSPPPVPSPAKHLGGFLWTGPRLPRAQGRLYLCSPLPATCFRGALTSHSGVTCHRNALVLRRGKSIETESKISGCHGLGGGENEERLQKGFGVLFCSEISDEAPATLRIQ